MSTSTEWYAHISVSLDHRNLATDVHTVWQSVIFLRVYNFPNEEDSVGEFIQNHHEKWSVESDPRWARKIPRSPGHLLHCGPGCLSAILMNIQHGSVDHLQGTKQTASSWQSSKKRAVCHPLPFGQQREPCLEQDSAAAAASGKVLTHCSAPIAAPAAIAPLKPSSFPACAESNPQTAGSQRALKMTDDKKLWKQRNLVI